ncbi:carbohydrate sulfotransferase 15 [Spea bombifrons]|uniref:carbohydrate sulfotransferase 15 n=1 Tax=Spea bombifrons TaxID=233779 RepID=UPI00234A4B08|nr:carbohydrate sulfotransferase 15 [Spea bombifrons]
MSLIKSHQVQLQKVLIRGKLFSLLVALVITVLVVASYVLSGGGQDLSQTLSPSTSKDFVLGSNLSSTEEQTECTQPNRPCRVNITYATSQLKGPYVHHGEIHLTDRRIPNREELAQYEPHLFSVIPQHFIQSSRSPCWYTPFNGNYTADPYRTNAYARYAKRLHSIFEEIRQGFWVQLQQRGEENYRLRCIPYFYIIGQPKCGTTDLYDRLRLHPEVRFSAIKEPHWWTRKRFGILRLKEPFGRPFPVEDYLDLFDLAAHEIQSRYKEDGMIDPLVIGEASASTMWDNNAWSYFYDNVTNTEPPVLIQDFIHAFQPNTKFIVMLRDPIERLYSDYLYFAIANKSVEDFHDKVNESLQIFESCLHNSTLRACAYNTTFSNVLPVRLQIGLYVVYLWDWLSLFDRDQFLILRLEDHAANISQSMRLVYRFLGLGPLSDKEEASVIQNPASNSRRPEDCSLGPMFSQTRQLLKDFYHPYNQKLAEMLMDNAFKWET